MNSNRVPKPRGISPRSVAVFAMPEVSHFHRLESMISGLTRSGVEVHVFTHRNFERRVESAGGVFFDLFARYPLEYADDTLLPIPCSFVSFAAVYGRQICRDVEKIGASLVIQDGFAVIGRVVATVLDIPRVNICAGHNMAPACFLALLKEDPRVKLSAKCLRAVEELRESYGMADASPFSYVSSLSAHLNIYCEAPEFLEERERKAFGPVAFYRSFPSLVGGQGGPRGSRRWFGAGSARMLKVYVSFGTVIWRYYAVTALSVLNTLAAAFGRMENVQAVISLGGTELTIEELAALLRPNVSVERYVDQWDLLQETDVFFTHHGLNSTHEAIFHGVPMVSYPFFSDQPALAAKCRQFGLATPLTDSVRGVFSEDDVRAALARLAGEKKSMQAALSRARE